MLVRIEAATTAPASSAVSPSTSRRSRPRGAVAERLVAALRGGDEARPRAQRVDGAEHERAREQDALRDQRLPVARLPQRAERRQVDDARDDAGREQDGHAAHGRAREARDDDREHRDALARLGRRRPARAGRRARRSRSTRLPGAPSRARASPRRGSSSTGGRRGRAGRAPPPRSRPRRSAASSASPERRLRPGRSSASAAPAATASSASTAQRSLNARPKPESRTSGTISPMSLHGLSENSAVASSEVDGRRDERDAQRDGRRRRDALQRALAPARHLQRPRDHAAEREQADRAHHRQQQHPARADEARRGRALAERRDDELRRRSGTRPDGERERAADRVPVGRDDAPPDEVPALRERLDRDEDRVLVVGRARRAPGDLLVAAGVRDRDDREARLDALAEGEPHLGRRLGEHAARLWLRGEQRGVSPRQRRHAPVQPRRRRAARPPARRSSFRAPPGDQAGTADEQPERADDERDDGDRLARVGVRRLGAVPSSAAPTATTGAGVSESSEPAQSTTLPSE